jgi:hypothetical protein
MIAGAGAAESCFWVLDRRRALLKSSFPPSDDDQNHQIRVRWGKLEGCDPRTAQISRSTQSSDRRGMSSGLPGGPGWLRDIDQHEEDSNGRFAASCRSSLEIARRKTEISFRSASEPLIGCSALEAMHATSTQNPPSSLVAPLTPSPECLSTSQLFNFSSPHPWLSGLPFSRPLQ